MNIKKYIAQKIDEYLELSEHPSLDKKEAAKLIAEKILKDPKFKKNIHPSTLADLKDEVFDEVLETLQKKTYGFFSLKDYLDKTK